ncbi:MAG: hypothetical protein KC983_12240, partial [Phycisphaerales bacterium]|nr:hypothetical protein [Phycisphaerales bacterium]
GDGTFGNGIINIDDLLETLNNFGNCPAEPAACPCDSAPAEGDCVIGNGIVNIDDLLLVINNFGPC